MQRSASLAQAINVMASDSDLVSSRRQRKVRIRWSNLVCRDTYVMSYDTMDSKGKHSKDRGGVLRFVDPGRFAMTEEGMRKQPPGKRS